MGWQKFKGEVKGTRVEGDPAARPTRWWNWWYLAWWGWGTVVVFQIKYKIYSSKGYRVGYKPSKGATRVKNVILQNRRFRMRIGHEACTFFAFNQKWKEIPLRLVARTTIWDAKYQKVPLI